MSGRLFPDKAPETPDLADMRPDDWVARWLPPSWGPYARLCRLDRPVGTWLTLLPCLAALVQAADGWPPLFRLFIFSLGALLMRGKIGRASCRARGGQYGLISGVAG